MLFSISLLLVPVIAVAQDYCEGNFDYDQDVDGADASMFKQDFGRSGLINPCPDDGPAPVPKTGQNVSFARGDDGDAEKGVSWPNPRFADNGNGSVTDNLTGLIWLKNADCFGTRTWSNALSDSNELNSGECGLTDGSNAGDWRLPNRFELESLLDMQSIAPALPSDHPFINVQTTLYWSSSTYLNYGYAWYLDMFNMMLAMAISPTCTSCGLFVEDIDCLGFEKFEGGIG